MKWPWRSAKTEGRGSDWASTWLSFGDLIGTGNTTAGVNVTERNAIMHPAVYRCLDLNQSTISSFPVDCLVKRAGSRLPYPEPQWLKAPNDEQDFHDLIGEAVVSMDQYNAAFLLKSVGSNGVVSGLSVLDPNAVEMTRVDLGDGVPRVIYLVATGRGRVRLAANEILYIRAGLPVPGFLRGVSPVAAAYETIGLGIAARQYGSNFYGSGATLSGVIETTANMAPEQADRLKAAFTRKHGGVSKSHAIGILSGGASWKPIETTPDKAMALDTLKYTDGVIASFFGIPAEYVSPAIEGAKGYVTGLYQRQQLWYQTGLFPRITKLERRLSTLLPGGAYIKLNVDAWLRMDPEQRVAYYSAGQQGEWLSIEEIRALEDMNPQPEGRVLHSVQWQENAPQPPGQTEPDSDEEDAGSDLSNDQEEEAQ